MSTPNSRDAKGSDSKFDYDLVVIGSGPAGIHAAVQGAKLQKRVAVIERIPGKIGGAWIHTGTLPSKTMREVLDAIHTIHTHVGASWVQRIVTDMSSTKLFGRAICVAKQEETLVRKHLSNNNVEIIEGQGVIEDQHQIRVLTNSGATRLITTRNMLIGTGSRPRRPDDIPFDGWRIVDSDEILTLEHVPKSIIIYGAGVIGCEYACIFGALGVKTTLVDVRSCMLQTIDQEVTHELQRAIQSLGVEIRLGHKIENLKVNGPRVSCTIGGQPMETDVVFFAAGRVSNTDHLGLEKIGITANDRGAIPVNENFQTCVPNIYAAGDVIGPPALAATSTAQGRHACLHAFGVETAPFPQVFPIGIYTIPELSSVGASEEELKAQNVEYEVGRATFNEIARGYIAGETHGLLKLLIDRKTQKILGLHIIGSGACNLIHIGMAFMLNGGHCQDLVNMIFNYPTLAEAYRVAAFNGLNKVFKGGAIEAPNRSAGNSSPSKKKAA